MGERGMPGFSESIVSTMRHIDLLTTKRDRLIGAANEAVRALCCSIERTEVTPSEAVALWEWTRGLGLPHTAQSIADAAGYDITTLAQWSRTSPPDLVAGVAFSGEFPLYFQMIPTRGVPCVYVLFADEAAIYIGRSENVKDRLRTHWREKRQHGIDRWWVMSCANAESMAQLERELIREHQPLLNVVGK